MPNDAPGILERIESRLERLGLSPEQACAEAGLPPDLLARLAAGKAAVPRGRKLARLAEALSTSVSYLVGLDPDTQPPPEWLEEDQGSFGLLAGDEEALLGAYRRLDPPAKSALLLVVRKMAGPEPVPDAVPVKVVRRCG